MKTLTDLKRKLTVGTKLRLTWAKHASHFRYPEDREALANGSGLARTVTKVQSNGIYVQTARGLDSWLDWPKASCLLLNDKEFTILELGEPILRYRVEE